MTYSLIIITSVARYQGENGLRCQCYKITNPKLNNMILLSNVTSNVRTMFVFYLEPELEGFGISDSYVAVETLFVPK